MARTRIHYECGACGHTTAKWLGVCPSCNEWHTFVEMRKEKVSDEKKHKIEIGPSDSEQYKAVKLDEITYREEERLKTGIGEFDRVLGGGLMPSSLILLGGDPGIGKSTLMLQIAKSSPELNLLYIAGEESAGQIRQRADRIGIGKSRMKVIASTDLDKVIASARQEKPDLLVIDSIQTVYRSRLNSLPGSIQQVRECAALLQQLAKRENITTLMIGHVTKEGAIAGPRILEHMVDTVLHFEGDQGRFYRLLRSMKNRFGPAQETGVFEMNDQGLKELLNPSELFLSDLDQHVSGNAVTCVMEGSRPILVEIQALVTPGNFGNPQRTASGFDQRRLSLLLAVLEKRAGLKFSDQDVYLNVAGGLKISDTAADLAVICALASSYKDKPVRGRIFIIGETGLGGEVRMVPKIEQRISEGAKMGFEKAIVPVKSKSENTQRLQIKKSRFISMAIETALDENT